jgi:hypothetical protein
MKPMSRACLIFILASACVDAEAAVDRRCVASLEAQSPDVAHKPTMAPKRPCPVAIAYTRGARDPRGRVDDATRPAPGNVRV